MTRSEAEKIVSDLKTVAHDAESLLMATAGVAGQKAHEMRERIKTALDSTKDMFVDIENRAIAGAKSTDKVIRNNPYKSIGVALGVGTVIGAAIASKTMKH